MSYDYRTPAEKVLPSLSTQSIENISPFSSRLFETYEENKGKLFNYHLSNDKKNFASRHGIYLSPFPFMSHSHPFTEGDPWMKGMMTMIDHIEPTEPDVTEPEVQDIKTKVHLPIVDKAFAFTIIDDKLRAKEYREARMKDSWSNQFKDDNKNIKSEMSTGPVNFEAIFPRHSKFIKWQNDDVVLKLALWNYRKRRKKMMAKHQVLLFTVKLYLIEK